MKRILRLSTSGILTLSVVACGNDDIPQSHLASGATEGSTERVQLNEDKTCQESVVQDVDQFLKDLQSQGRITDCEMIQVTDDGSIPTDVPEEQAE